METFTLSRKELHRPGLLKALCAGRITNRQAATALRLSVRQLQRLKRQFQADEPNRLWVTDLTFVATWEGWPTHASSLTRSRG